MKEKPPRMLDPEYDGEDGPKPITVDQLEGWKTASVGNKIETTGLGVCIGVIIYDPDSKQALVGHFADPREENLNGMLTEARGKFPKASQLKIYLGGSEPDPTEAPEYPTTKAKRKFVTDQLKSRGFTDEQITTRWQDQGQATIMSIDTESGQVDYDQEDYDIYDD